jgi:uncharacterized membrane protein
MEQNTFTLNKNNVLQYFSIARVWKRKVTFLRKKRKFNIIVRWHKKVIPKHFVVVFQQLKDFQKNARMEITLGKYSISNNNSNNQPDQEGNKLQRQKILSFINPIYNHNWRNISTIYRYNKTSINRNFPTIKQNT